MNPRALLTWTLAGALALLGLGLADLLLVDRTLLTPYSESHPASEPRRHPATGLLHVEDLQTGEAFTLLPGNRVAYLDPATGRVDPEKDASAIRLGQGKIVRRHEPLSPLYAFFVPLRADHRPRLLFALALCALVLLVVPRLERIPHAGWLLLLPVLAVLVRAAFAWIRQPLGEIGSQLLLYENEELLFDVPRVGSLRSFLDDYAGNMRNASLHGSHFPPGYILLLKGIALVAGHSSQAAIEDHVALYGWSLLVLGATALVPLYLLARDLSGARAARFGAALFLFAPNSIAFGAVSLDAVFCAAALWTIWAFRRAVDVGSATLAAVGGVLLGLTTFLSFSGLVLGLFLALLFVLGWRDVPLRRRIVPLACFAGGAGLFVAVLDVAFGFDFVACLRNARVLEAALMEQAAAQRGTSLVALRGYLVWANLGAFFLGSGLALLGPWLLAVRDAVRALRSRASSLAAFTLALLGVLLAGATIYHMETERIWLYLTAGIAISVGGLLAAAAPHARAERMLRLVAGSLALQAAASEALLFTLW